MPPTTHLEPQDPRSRLVLCLHVVFLVALSGYYESLFIHLGINLLDEGWILYTAKRLWEGGTLYDDTFFVFPPAHVLPAWIAYGIDPPGLVASRWIYAGFNISLCVTLYLLGRRLMKPGYALLAAALVAIHSPYSHGAHFLFGYRYLVWSILALLAFSRRLQTGDPRWLLLAGAWAGIALAFRLTPAFSVSVGIGFGILASSRDWRSWLADGAWYSAGLLATVGPVLAWLFADVSPAVVWSEAVQRPVEMTEMQALGVPDLFLPESWDRWQIQLASLAAGFRLAPLLYAGYLVFLAVSWARDLRQGTMRTSPLLVAVVFFGAVYLGRGFGRADQGHLDTALPPVLLLLGHLLGEIDRWLARQISPLYASALMATTSLAVFLAIAGVQRVDQRFFEKPRDLHPLEALKGRVKIGFLRGKTDPPVRLIQRFTRPGETILDLSASPMLYVLSQRNGPGFADTVMPGTFRDTEEEARFVERLRADPPALVLEAREPFDRRPENELSISMPLLAAWVEDNYATGEATHYYVARPKRRPQLPASGPGSLKEGFATRRR